MKTFRYLFLPLIAVFVLAACSGNSTQENSDSAKKADSAKAAFKKDSLKKDSLRKDSLRKDSITQANAVPAKPTDADQLLKDIKAGKTKVYFQGSGTEPFWTIYVTKYELLKVDEGFNTQTSYLLVNQFDSKLKKQTISYKDAAGKIASIIITLDAAGKGTGPNIYPYSVHLGPYLDGAGDTMYIKDRDKYEGTIN